MSEIEGAAVGDYPVRVRLEPHPGDRNRLTTAFRLILALPHILLVGGPIALALSWGSAAGEADNFDWSAGGGLLGAVAALCAFISWFWILVTGRQPQGLWDLSAFYLRWRVRAVAYTALFRDEYPPFGDGPYAASLEMQRPEAPRDRVTVFFRLILAIPHILCVWLLGIAWCVTSVAAWLMILFTGLYPQTLYDFGVGVFRWSIRVDAYLLLLRDEYPPFSME